MNWNISYVLILVYMSIFIFSGCLSSETVEIKVKVDSKIDMTKYKTIAVIDFVDKKTKPDEMNGKIIARMIRQQLNKSKEFQVLEEKNMEFDSPITYEDINDPMVLSTIGRQLDVDAIIIGEFDFYQRYQSVPYITERYSIQTGKYMPEGRSYIRKVYGISLKIKVIDSKTGETIFNYNPRVEEQPEYRSSFALPFTDGTNDPSNFRAIVAKPVTKFVLSLVPHYEKERRYLVK